MTRRTVAALAVAGALAGPAAAADPGAPALHASPSVEAIAPGGNISSVVDATAARGWPHRPDVNERADVRALVVATFAPPRARVRIGCAFGRTMGAPIRCRLRIARGADLTVFIGLPATRTATGRVLPRVPGVWEDGSYRFSAVISATEED